MSSAAPAPHPVRNRWKQALHHKEAPLAWKATIAAFIALGVGAAAAAIVAAAAGDAFTSVVQAVSKMLPAGIVAMFVMVAGLSAPRAKALTAVITVSAVMMLMLFVAWITLGVPWASGLAMALVMGLGVLAARRGKAMGGLAALMAGAYFVFATVGLVRGLGSLDTLAQGLIGALSAVVLLLGVHVLRATTGLFVHAAPEDPGTGEAAASAAGAGHDERRGEERTLYSRRMIIAYALLRGVVLGVAAGVYAATDNHNVFWLFVTLWAVMQPAPDASLDRGLQRVTGVMLGCLVIAVLAVVAPPAVVMTVGMGAMFVGFLWMQRDYAVYAAAISMFTVSLHGAMAGQAFLQFAGWRALDTILGALLAFTLLWMLFDLPSVIRRRHAA